MSDLSDRAYEKLEPRERVLAALSAAGRHDLAEVDRLVDTCGKVTYRMTNDDFTRPVRRFALMAERHHAKLTSMTLAAVSILLLAQSAGESAGDDKAYESLDRCRAAIKGGIEAWDSLCREIGLVEEEARGFAPIGEDDGVLGSSLPLLFLEEIEADESYGLKYLSSLRDEWQRQHREFGD